MSWCLALNSVSPGDSFVIGGRDLREDEQVSPSHGVSNVISEVKTYLAVSTQYISKTPASSTGHATNVFWNHATVCWNAPSYPAFTSGIERLGRAANPWVVPAKRMNSDIQA